MGYLAPKGEMMQPNLPITDHQAVGKQIRNPLRGDKKASQYSAYHGPRDGGLQRFLPTHTEAEGPIIWVHDMLRSTVLNQQYPCIGARSAFNRDHYRIGFYPPAATEPASLGLAHDLYEFTQEYSDQSVPFYSFIAVFDGPVASTEVEFERLLWEQLQALHNIDARYCSWDSFVTRDPDHPQFCFSFGGKGYFVVGLHAAASRLARRFAWPAMVFNAHEMFDRVRDDGKFPKLQSTIRNRDQRLQGFINPVVKDFGTESEARQYSGRNVENDWRCPFRPRDAGQS